MGRSGAPPVAHGSRMMEEGSRAPFLSPVQPHMGAWATPSRRETNTVPAGHCRSVYGSSKWPRRKTAEPAGALVTANATSNAPRQIKDRDYLALIQMRGVMIGDRALRHGDGSVFLPGDGRRQWPGSVELGVVCCDPRVMELVVRPSPPADGQDFRRPFQSFLAILA